jgi:hypothetical protein
LIYDLRFTIYEQTEKTTARHFLKPSGWPPGFGLRQFSGAFPVRLENNRELPQFKTLSRHCLPLIAEQFFHPLPSHGFTRIGSGFRRPDPAGKFKELAEVANVFFQHRFGQALAALLGHARIVMRAVQADAQVGPAFHASFAAPRLAVQRPKLAAVMAMTRHLRFMIDDLRLPCRNDAVQIINRKSQIIN